MLKRAVFYSTLEQMWRRRTTCEQPSLIMMIIFTQRNSVSLFNFFCSSGARPLHWSARNSHIETCRVLLDARADVEAKAE